MENIVIGYVFHDYGYWEHQYYFEGSVEKVATFLYQHRNKDVVITDTLDMPIYKTPCFYETVNKKWCDLVHNRVIELLNQQSETKLDFIYKETSWIEIELATKEDQRNGNTANY